MGDVKAWRFTASRSLKPFIHNALTLTSNNRALAFILFLSSGVAESGCTTLTPDQTVALSNAAMVVVTAILQAAKQ